MNSSWVIINLIRMTRVFLFINCSFGVWKCWDSEKLVILLELDCMFSSQSTYYFFSHYTISLLKSDKMFCFLVSYTSLMTFSHFNLRLFTFFDFRRSLPLFFNITQTNPKWSSKIYFPFPNIKCSSFPEFYLCLIVFLMLHAL